MKQGKITIGKYTAKRSSNQIFSFAGYVFEGTFQNHNAPKEKINLDKILVKKGRLTNKKGESASLSGSMSCLLNGRGSVELFDENGKTLQCFEGVYKMGKPWKGFAQDASRSRIIGKYQDGKFINADDLVSTRMTRSKSRSMHQGSTSANGTATQARSVAVSVAIVASNTTNSTSSTTAAATVFASSNKSQLQSISISTSSAAVDRDRTRQITFTHIRCAMTYRSSELWEKFSVTESKWNQISEREVPSLLKDANAYVRLRENRGMYMTLNRIPLFKIRFHASSNAFQFLCAFALGSTLRQWVPESRVKLGEADGNRDFVSPALKSKLRNSKPNTTVTLKNVFAHVFSEPPLQQKQGEVRKVKATVTPVNVVTASKRKTTSSKSSGNQEISSKKKAKIAKDAGREENTLATHFRYIIEKPRKKKSRPQCYWEAYFPDIKDWRPTRAECVSRVFNSTTLQYLRDNSPAYMSVKPITLYKLRYHMKAKRFDVLCNTSPDNDTNHWLPIDDFDIVEGNINKEDFDSAKRAAKTGRENCRENCCEYLIPPSTVPQKMVRENALDNVSSTTRF